MALKATHMEFLHRSLITEYLDSPVKTVAADVLVIPVVEPYVQKTTGADAEALTLANGLAGQLLQIKLVTDGGGDGTLTPATSTDWATIVFADAGDTAWLYYVDDTVGWIIFSVFGLTAQPTVTV